MNTVLYCSANGAVYEANTYAKSDIDQLVHSRGLQCLTSADGQFDFWFSPTTRKCQRRVNQSATELLLATTSFTAKSVPLLRGAVVIATHDPDGEFDGLSWVQLDLLAERNQSITKRDERVLNRRVARDAKTRREAGSAPVREFTPRVAA